MVFLPPLWLWGTEMHCGSHLLPLYTQRRAALHYALLPPSLRTPAWPRPRASAILDSPGLNHLFITSPIFVSSPTLYPAAVLIVICLCVSFTFKSFSRRSYPERLTNWCIHLMTCFPVLTRSLLCCGFNKRAIHCVTFNDQNIAFIYSQCSQGKCFAR
jgi:hypothetical protein